MEVKRQLAIRRVVEALVHLAGVVHQKLSRLQSIVNTATAVSLLPFETDDYCVFLVGMGKRARDEAVVTDTVVRPHSAMRVPAPVEKQRIPAFHRHDCPSS